MKKHFIINHPATDWSCKVEVDEDFTFPDYSDKTKSLRPIDAMQMMVKFWSNWESRLDAHNGDYQATFLQQLGREIFYISIDGKKTISGIIRAFKTTEGWCEMDGSYGIRIIEVDDLTFDHWEFNVEEVNP